MNNLHSVWLACLFAGLTGPALAASDPLANLSEHFAPELGDSELANLRGRYAGPQGIRYFGIEFISTLTTAQAQQTAAMNLTLSVIQNHPNLDIRIKSDAKTAVSAAPAASNINGSGLVQVVQLQGSGNSSVNQTGITFTAPPTTGQSVNAGNYESQGALGTASYRVSGNYAGLQLNSADGHVQLEQSLRGDNFSRGLLQLNRVRGDGLQALNQTRIWLSR
ncbi:hypothetical protein [Aeromonas molluscorum]|jgi:hypothetical protein|uniref:Uncharacterized protein n=1 Tax=Aeromonas molluscorum 848 TaxID=1268236 RepID=R1H1S9_9GAMM|nr:hypothetical protein [Aeromonas molluscorum]EOD54581.1 hypothetical protein G113_13569 [Aeromonas molluscorum 848]